MRTLLLLLASAALAQQPLSSRIHSQSPAWFAYKVPSVHQESENCWQEGQGKKLLPIALEGSNQAVVLVRLQGNQVGKVRLFPAECSFDAGGVPVVWLKDVTPAESIAYLEKLALASEEPIADSAVFAIAQHAAVEADTAMDMLTEPQRPGREKAIFWLGACRGAPGVVALNRILHSDPSEQVRAKAVFALSVSPQPEALNLMLQAASNDPSAHVRGQALFWLAHKAGERSAKAIINAIENDPDSGVKKQAVFALAQLPPQEGIPKLIEVAGTQRNPDVRKQAFFWLGQSKDPRALTFIQSVLLK
jgi:hypothetical protein